jgi:hypothetical protein
VDPDSKRSAPRAAARLLVWEPGTRGRCAEQAGGRSRGGPAENPTKSDSLKVLRDAVPSGRGGPRQQTKRGILGKHPWAAARLLVWEPGTRGRCAEQAGGRSRGGPAEDPTKSNCFKLLRTPCRVEGVNPDSKRSAGSLANTLGKPLVCLPGNRGRGVAAPSKREVGLVGVPQSTTPKVII